MKQWLPAGSIQAVNATTTEVEPALPGVEVAPPPGPGAPPSMAAIRAIAFVVGAASLGAEISAARLLAPYFGASTIIWANTIATVLVALSAGYAIGGKLADRRGDLRGLSAIVLLAAAALAAVPFAADPFLRLSVRALGALSVGGFFASLAAVLMLVAVPVVLLGTVAPYANRLALGRVADTGTVTGRLYALSTAGSLLGTFLSALLLIPLIGTHRTFLVFAFALAAVAAPAAGSRRLLAVPVAIAALALVPPPAIGADVAGARVIYSAETPYQYVRVLQFASGERWLQLNEGVAIHSLYRPWSYLTGGYWDDFLVLPLAGQEGVPNRVAILGDAAGTVARAYGHYFPGTRVDGVELDGELNAIGKRYFGLRGPRLHLYTADARPWLAASKTRYDAVFLDAYRQPYIPFYLLTREFFKSVQRAPAPRRDADRQRRAHSRLRRAREGCLGHGRSGVPVSRPRSGLRHELAGARELQAALGRSPSPGGRPGACPGAETAGASRRLEAPGAAARRSGLHRRPRSGGVAHGPLDRALCIRRALDCRPVRECLSR